MAERARAGASWSGQARAGVAGSTDGPEPQDFPTGDQLSGLSALAPDQRLDHIAELVRTALAEVLHTSDTDIEANSEFVALGMDSLTAMDLYRRLQAMLGTDIPASLFFAHPTPAALARALLAMWEHRSADPEQIAISRVPRDGELPLSHAEEQLWFLNQLLPSSSAYNVAARVNIPGPVNRDVLRRSLDAVIAHHEVLHTTFRSARGVPQAVVGAPQPVGLRFEQMSTEAEITAAAAAEAAIPFDIGVGPLLRARLFGLGDGRHVLVLTMHHIISDGWSFRVLLRDLARIYQALERGEPSPLGELPIQYRDYAQWERERLRGERFDALVGFWKDYLAGAPPLELDTDRPRPTFGTFRGARMHFDLGRELTAALRELCRARNVTTSVPLLAALSVVLHQFSGQDDIVIGTLSGNRARLETEDLIGLFVNALPVRIRLDGDPGVTELLTRVRQCLVDVLAHQGLPFDLIVNATAPDRDASRNPLFGVQFVLQPAARATERSGLGFEVAEIETHTAKRDLTFTFVDDDAITGHVEYATELFDATRIELLIAHLREVLDAMVSDLGRRLSGLPMLTESERAHYRTERSRLQTPQTPAGSIQELFEMTADHVPDAVAVTADGHSLTYRELDAAANRLAWRLRSLGVKAGTVVGFSPRRAVGMAVGMLAILKAGGVYVPVDPSYPKDRARIMLDDAGVQLLLDENEIESPSVQQESAERLPSAVAPDDLAYVMYTSGSTGRPKGVAVTHRGVVEYVQTLGRDLALAADDVYLETASISFSSSIRQLMAPLAIGAQVVIVTNEERHDPAALLRRIDESQVTVADLVPTMVAGMVRCIRETQPAVPLPSRLRLLLTASEPLRAGIVRAWRDRIGGNITWINMYGQTETTGIVSLYRVGQVRGSDQSIVPIGRPRGNVGMYVLDQRMRLVPPGVSGQLFIAGTALAREYVGDPALTARKFLPAPWDPGERLYASGDVVRLGWDGTIEFRNRTDGQVKIRGLRVEPGEIDQALLDHPGVRDAVTIVQNIDGEPGVLVAYVVAESEHVSGPVSVGELRDHTRRRLPEHMVPAAFVLLERLPLTPNGKLDRAALPEVTIRRDPEVEYIPPRAGLEESLASIWRSILPVEQIGAGDNFFALGGHSLLAAQLRSRIHQLLGVHLPLEVLFEHQTLAELARRIEESGTSAGEAPELRPAPRGGTVPASYAQEQIWQAERDDPGAAAHWIDVSIRIIGPLEAALLVRAVQDVVQRHDLLRTVFRPTATTLAQVILDAHVPDVPVVDAQPTTTAEHNGEWRDLDIRPPLRAEVLRVADDNHILRLRAHRILVDGHSMRVLLGEIGAAIANRLGTDKVSGVSLPGRELQYADYAYWERQWLTGAALARRVDYFREQFALGELPPGLPTDYPRCDRRARQGRRYAFEFSPEIAEAARTLAIREQASLYMVLLAAFAVALGRYADRRALVIGAPVTRRSDPATQLIIGPFMNTVPLRVDLDADPELPAVIREVKAKVLGALSNQDAPWHYVIAALTAQHGEIARGIGEVAFLMDEPVPAEFSVGGFAFSHVPPQRLSVRRELTVAMSTQGGGISGTVTYDGALFESRSIERIVTSFVAVLSPSNTRRMAIASELRRSR
ncbi:non-ribosomal peptide synthetase [Mycobacterium gastri]|uniref:Carrier domain-containing protein n=1 Tax=Mycobacterium gastri TaxID=1777 RepID=A0A1X1VS37_MYCGS|nr:hypothetical protein MGAST_12660 [Mycobacterium gastri 'Wayne']ORV71900.1 hypothetical protein AWC07_04540 [Mycobacterium gastri]